MSSLVNYVVNLFSNSNDYWYILFFLIAWVISYVSFPVIITISNEKDLLASPCERSSHTKKTPTLGGVGIFIGFMLAITIFGSLFTNIQLYQLMSCILVLFFLGLKDDIVVLSAKTKFSVQLVVTLLLIINSGLTITNLYGILGIHQLNSFFSILLTTFIFILIINAYNLIDGVDGLAGTVALCFLLVSSGIFYCANDVTMCVISLSLMGTIVAFLQYNFSNRRKIFMGDTGSMIVGFILCFLLIHILNLKDIKFGSYNFQINPMLLLSLLFFPLLDTARVFFVRIFIHKKSPFAADKNHIHHSLLKLGFNHWQISLFVGLATFTLCYISLLIDNLPINIQLTTILSLGTLLFSSPQLLNKMKKIDFSFLKNGTLSVALLLSFLLFQSCTTKKDILYFKSGNKNPLVDAKIENQKIETNDILAIKIYSIDAESSRIYNIDLLESTTGGAQMNLESMKLKGYLVNDEGFIILPVLGNLKVTDKSTKDLEVFLTKKLIDEGHLKAPTVTVRIINSKITILGEVRSPGTYTFAEKNLTLLQAIGLAGDLTINGERKEVLLIRQEDNIKTIHHINLTSTDWMSTELFYIKQNDVIVVNPNNAKIKSAGIIGNTGTLISVISLLLTGLLLIKK